MRACMCVAGFTDTGVVTNYRGAEIAAKKVPEIVASSSKVVTLVDLAGHEKYLRTTVFGLTSQAPDYAMMTVSAKLGVERMTKEHFALAMALKVPTFIVITKCDLVTAKQLQTVVGNLRSIITVSSFDDWRRASHGMKRWHVGVCAAVIRR